MPIEVIPAREAIEVLKSNAASTWPARGSENNRIEPLALPVFAPSFSIARGESIFTIGSCFARNVEAALLDRGFELPSRDILKSDPEFAAIGPNVLNNYGVPSIYNEIAWAFDLMPFDPKQNFFAAGKGKFVDIHLNQALRPADYEVVERRRAAIRTAYTQIKVAKVIVITLGLTECWFDRETGLYLNTSPRRSIIREFPDRFELRVLNYAETMDFLDRIFVAIKEHGHPAVRIVLTVSPVPLQATYRKMDVAIANMYSKSVLRVAAEEAVAKYPFADYFPSFESILLTDRNLAWEDDLTHIKKPVVDANVSRMVERYVMGAAAPIAESGAALLRRMREAETKRRGAAFAELEGREDLLRASPDLAILFAESAIAVKKIEASRSALALLPSSIEGEKTLWAKAQIAFRSEDYEGTVEKLSNAPALFHRRQLYWAMLLNSYAHLKKTEEIKDAVERWAKVSPHSATPYRTGAVLLGKAKDNRTAEYMFRKAMTLREDGDARVDLDYAEYLANAGRIQLARNALGNFKPATPVQAQRHEELKLKLAR